VPAQVSSTPRDIWVVALLALPTEVFTGWVVTCLAVACTPVVEAHPFPTSTHLMACATLPTEVILRRSVTSLTISCILMVKATFAPNCPSNVTGAALSGKVIGWLDRLVAGEAVLGSFDIVIEAPSIPAGIIQRNG